MTTRAKPLLYLAEPPARKTVSLSKVSAFDHFALFSTFLLVIGGAILILDHASARSTGMEAQSLDWFVTISNMMSTCGQLIGEYTALLGAGMLSIFTIVAFVVGLRLLDSLHSERLYASRSKDLSQGLAYNSKVAKESRSYLLAPVFQ